MLVAWLITPGIKTLSSGRAMFSQDSPFVFVSRIGSDCLHGSFECYRCYARIQSRVAPGFSEFNPSYVMFHSNSIKSWFGWSVKLPLQPLQGMDNG